jgi:hypothetical protein
MTQPRKLKASEVKQYREDLLKLQNNMCALCDEIIEDGKAVLDHDHKSGQVRGVLHRGCNALEGVIVNNMARNLVQLDRLLKIFGNWQAYHDQIQSQVLHPTHRTSEERAQRAKKRAKARRKK